MKLKTDYLWLIQSLVAKVAPVITTGTRLTSDEAKNFVRARVEKINLLPSNSGISARSAHSTQVEQKYSIGLLSISEQRMVYIILRGGQMGIPNCLKFTLNLR